MLSKITLRTKLVLYIAALSIVTAGILLFYLPGHQREQSMRVLRTSALSMSSFVASALSAPVALHDKELVRDLIKDAKDNSLVRYIVVHDEKGRLGGFRQHLAAKLALPRSGGAQTKVAAGMLNVSIPVVGKKQNVGRLLMGFSTDTVDETVSKGLFTIIALSGGIFLFGAFFALVVGTIIARPILGLTAAASRIAEGKLDTEALKVVGRDEIAKMGTSFNSMVDTLRHLRTEVARVADGNLKVTDLEGDLPAAFNRMIENQRALVKQLDDTAMELTAAASEFQANAEQQQRGAVEQSSALEENQRIMQGLLETSRSIAEAAQGVLESAEKTDRNSRLVADQISALSSQTQRIGEILSVIKEIANKSEILALNAALEGTKAGEAGRGFSLVARQMQRLAENVMSSVGSIRELTETIIAATRQAVMATDENTRIAAETTRSARQIAMTVQHQRSGTEQANQSIDDVARISREAAAGSREIAASTSDLVTLSQRMKELAGQFKTD